MDNSTENQDDPGSIGDLPLKHFSIDERFNFKVDLKRAPSAPAPASGTDTVHDLEITVEMDPHRKPGPSESDSDPLLGQRIGNFEIIHRLGQGGFGSVYKARDVKLDRFVALKFLRFPLDSVYRKLFTTEGQLLANLSHPSIVQVYTSGEHQGSYYFALEFVDGSAENLIEQSGGRLPVSRALEIVSQCADALHFAHENGVFHRDIKPANILIDGKSGRAKVCDFGLAKLRTLGAGQSAGQMAGSPPYMAPEQVMAGHVDARTDVYGLGVTLYELLSGRLPFEGDSQAKILERIRKGKHVPLEQRRSDLAKSVLQIVSRATAWHARDRFQSAAELKRIVDRLLAQMDSSGSATTPTIVTLSGILRHRRVMRFGLATLVALAAVAGIRTFWPASSLPEDGWPKAVAEARELVDAGKLEDARLQLEVHLATHPTDENALYVLGFTHFLLGKFDTAQAEFARITTPALREEGIAALKTAQEKEAARFALEAATALVPTGYPTILMASLDVLKGDNASAIKRLETVDAEHLNFDWQRRDMHRLQSQAFLNTGNFQGAQVSLAFLPVDDPVARSMREVAARQQDVEVRKAVTEQLDRIAARMAAPATREATDPWTSRPLHARIEPPGKVNVYSQYAGDMAREFQNMLADALDKVPGRALEVVNRDLLGVGLFEQEASVLSPKGDAVELGRFWGARIIIQSEFGVFFGEEFAQIKLIDSETSEQYVLERRAFVPGFAKTDVEAWFRDLVGLIQQEIQEHFPLQGRITVKNDQAQINIGMNVDVTKGLEFVAFASEQSANPLDGITIHVDSVGKESAQVTVQGAASPAAANGWLVREVVPLPATPE